MTDHRQLEADYQGLLESTIAHRERELFILQGRKHALQARRDRGQVASLARAVQQMHTGGLSGPEREFFQETARQAGQAFDPQRVLLPWWALTAQRDLTAASAAAGGYLVDAPTMPARDILRPWSVTVRGGVTVVENLKGNPQAPRTSGSATVSWVSTESTQVSPSTPALASSAMTPHTAIGFVQASRQFMQQANPDAWLHRDLLGTTGQVFDQAVLGGTGAAGQPLGVLNATGIGTQSGTSLAWAGVLSMKRKAADKGAADGGITFVSTPAIRELLEARERASGGGSFIWQDDRIAGCPAFATTDMPAATMLSGPMSEIMVGIWGPGIVIEINPYDATLFKSGGVQIRVAISCDVAIVGDPAAFTKATSVT